MQITSVRHRKLVSLRGCEHKALEAESPPSGPASRRKRLLLLIVAAVCAFERELTDLLPRLSLRYRKCLRRKLLPSLSNDLAFVFRRRNARRHAAVLQRTATAAFLWLTISIASDTFTNFICCRTR